jgi:hypothetical protein
VLVCLGPSSHVTASSRSVLPGVMLWAWERPSDLRAIDAATGVAFLAQTITIDLDHADVTSRQWPLKVGPSTVLSAVTRIEMPVTRDVAHLEEDRLAAAIAITSTYPQVSAVQIDFDAVQSQRTFYRRLIENVRKRVDRRVPLSITALASWCVGDRWLDGLPIDEAVPMLFELGPENEPYRVVAVDASAAHRLCRASVGASLSEPIRIAADGRRVYVFNRQSWTPDTVSRAVSYARWLRGPW